MTPNRRHTGALAAVLVTLPAGSAVASGFMSARFGGEHGHPTTSNPSAMYYNPAGLALGTGTRLYLDGTFAYIAASFDRDPAGVYPVIEPGANGVGTPREDLDRNSGENSLLNFAAAPMVAVVSDFGVEGLGAGLGMYVPFGGASVWDEVSKFEGDPHYPGALNGSQRWWSIEGALRSLYITAAGAYEFKGPRLSVGAGLNLVMSEIHTIRARNAEAQDMTVSRFGTTIRPVEGRSRVDVSGKDLSVGAGLVWEPMDQLWIGLSYQSQPGFGKIELEGDLEQILGTATKSSTSKVRLEEELPDVIRLGGRWRPSTTTEVRLNGEYVRWGVFERQCLINQNPADPKKTSDCNLDGDGNLAEGSTSDVVQNIERDWEDAFAVRAGGSYWLKENLELYGSLGYDGNAVPDETLDPAIPDFHDVAISAGARVELLDKSLALAGTYTQFVYFSREISPRKDPGNGLKDITSLNPDAAGKYTRSIGALNINLEYTF